MLIRWPRLVVKMLRETTVDEAVAYLDVITQLKGSERLPMNVAFGRWFYVLNKMYKLNGNRVEF